MKKAPKGVVKRICNPPWAYVLVKKKDFSE